MAEARQGNFLPLEVTWRNLRWTHHSRLGGARPARPCDVGTSLIAVEPDGNVMPCHMYLYRRQDWFGTVDEKRFPPERETYTKISTANLLGCDTCLAEPICGGGCRAVAVGDRHDLHTGTHPGFCLNTRAHTRAVYRIYDTLMEEMPETFLAALRNDRPQTAAFGELAT